MTKRKTFDIKVSKGEQGTLLAYSGHHPNPRKIARINPISRRAILQKGLIDENNQVTELGWKVLNYYFVQYDDHGNITLVPLVKA